MNNVDIFLDLRDGGMPRFGCSSKGVVASLNIEKLMRGCRSSKEFRIRVRRDSWARRATDLTFLLPDQLYLMDPSL